MYKSGEYRGKRYWSKVFRQLGSGFLCDEDCFRDVQFPRQSIRLHILVRTPGGMALSWRAVRPSGPGDTTRNGLAALMFSGVIGCPIFDGRPLDTLQLGVCSRLGKDVGPVGLHGVSGWFLGVVDAIQNGIIYAAGSVLLPV